jgi:hypothetical protein
MQPVLALKQGSSRPGQPTPEPGRLDVSTGAGSRWIEAMAVPQVRAATSHRAQAAEDRAYMRKSPRQTDHLSEPSIAPLQPLNC